MEEVKKQFATSPLGAQGQNVSEFFSYVKDSKIKIKAEVMLSFEEYEFLKNAY